MRELKIGRPLLALRFALAARRIEWQDSPRLTDAATLAAAAGMALRRLTSAFLQIVAYVTAVTFGAESVY